MNKLIHALVLAFFGIGCWFLWGLLTVTGNAWASMGQQLPAFTRLCLGLRPLMAVLPLLALGYCLFVWLRRADTRTPWVGFFATTMASLVLVMLPILIAAYLPLVHMLHTVAAR